MKEWLSWDDESKSFSDQANLNEFVGWFFPVDRRIDGEEDDDGSLNKEPTPAELAESWDRRRIDKRDDLRNISYLITKAPKQWMEFRAGEELEKVYSRAVLNEIERDLGGVDEVDSQIS